jgi:ABC-type branched-subunit amino acid transport system substrate-binding protein
MEFNNQFKIITDSRRRKVSIIKKLLMISLVGIIAVGVFLTGCSQSEKTSTTTSVTSSVTTTKSTSTTGAPASSTTTVATQTTAAAKPVKLYIGGTFALTGAYAEDCAAVLAGFQDYTKYVNDNKIVAPWYPDKKIPANVTLEFLWGDDALAPDKAISIYDDLKGKGMLVERITGSPEGMALMKKLIDDKIGATSQSVSPAYLTPPANIFMNAPIYTDELAAIAEWFLGKWTDSSRKPRVAFLTADSTLGRNIITDEFQNYLKNLGFDFVGSQFVPMVPSSPPTTQLAWLKDNHVDLALGVMINSGTQPTIKEAVRLGMGPDQAYKITFGFGYPAHLQIFVPAMGTSGNGVIVAGDFCAQDANNDGNKFSDALQAKYRPDKKVTNVMYLDGILEAMTQVEALRLAMTQVAPDKLTAADVLEKGFQKINNFSTGGIVFTPLTYGPNTLVGVDQVRLQQVQNGKIVEIGAYPLRNIYKH